MDKAGTSGKQYKGGYRQINKALNICAFEDYLEKQLSQLPELPDVQQVSPRVLRVLGQNAGKVGSPELCHRACFTSNLPCIQPDLLLLSVVLFFFPLHPPSFFFFCLFLSYFFFEFLLL